MAERTLVMGILNVTPDSFSDGGRYAHVDDALAHAHEMVDQGADIVEVGGESTRPGSTRIGPDEEWARIGDVVRELAGGGIVVSVDTLHAVTARRAAAAGATIINDVSGGVWDPGMSASVASTGCRFVVQHYRALPGMPGESFDYVRMSWVRSWSVWAVRSMPRSGPESRRSASSSTPDWGSL